MFSVSAGEIAADVLRSGTHTERGLCSLHLLFLARGERDGSIGSPRGILTSSEHRQALRKAIVEARRDLVIVSPWLSPAAVNPELLGWLQAALDKNRELRVNILFGIERHAARGNQRVARPRDDMAARNQEAALQGLETVSGRSGGRLRVVEVGNTHEKVVISDDHYAIVSSFNFLSFNPPQEKGMRREMGYWISDPGEVLKLRALFREALGVAT